MKTEYDIIVIGAGHAGFEAVLAAARLKCKTLLVTLRFDTIGAMSCNPAIGGIGKGQLVKEIDALGGEMAKAADFAGIQFRILNASKGYAVWSSRVQEDRSLYKAYAQRVVKNQKNLTVKEAEVVRLLVKNKKVFGVQLKDGVRILAKAVIATTGTFLNGVIHIGLRHQEGGRLNEQSCIGLSQSLKELGFNILRFKTGTCPRLDGRTINFKKLAQQYGDKIPQPFSFSTNKIRQKQACCYITYTNEKTHKIIRASLNQSPLYTGKIKATGVRYCPSIEDKIVRFADKDRHQIFLEPEGLDTDEYYPNGVSTSLPVQTQMRILHSIRGLEGVKITRPGYGIEYDVVEPTQLYPTLETKLIKNLFCAGQINGTTGYEEAAAQGLIAGINAAQDVKKKPALTLGRQQAYIGVLIDDLTTKGTNEPYRMFTSRVEYRLLLREDNADIRLRKIGYEMGLVSKGEFKKTQEKEKKIKEGLRLLNEIKLRPSLAVNRRLIRLKTAPLSKTTSLIELLKRPQINFSDLQKFEKPLRNGFSKEVVKQVEIAVKYEGFIQRQLKEVEKFKNLENIKLPPEINYAKINSLSLEIKEKLNKVKPLTLGQAGRISGVTPAAISLLMIYLKTSSKPALEMVCIENGLEEYAL